MRILVANRGEIACRIIKSIKDMGHEAVAVYSTADKTSQHVQMADIAVCIGPNLAKESYLNMLNLLITATSLEIDGIHPGYGFLSENASFAELCEELNVKFIGPSPENIRLMGNKINALNIMNKANTKDSNNQFMEIKSQEDVSAAYNIIKLPLIIKYASGGGGKGMRIVKEKEELQSAYNLVLLEAKQAEENPKIFAEKFIQDAKHIEIQVIGDKFGNAVHVGSRDCSMQRNSQKIIEEAPANINISVLEKLIETSLNIVNEIKYEGVGTIEFLVKDNEFYFLEMNTRLQVEHTVTEQISNIDLVKEQINIAFGNAISFSQEKVSLNNHSIECRINAEDPSNNFNPCPGKIADLTLYEAKGVRNDFGFIKGDIISPFYDSLIGKIIVTAKTREDAITLMIEALENTKISGIKTNIDFNILILKEEVFKNNTHTTTYIKDNYSSLKQKLD